MEGVGECHDSSACHELVVDVCHEARVCVYHEESYINLCHGESLLSVP